MVKNTDQDNEIAKYKAIVDKNGFDIKNRKYTFAKMPFKYGKKIFAFATLIGDELDRGRLSFIDTPKFEQEIEPILMSHVMIDGHLLNKVDDHFDEFTGDYPQFVVNSIMGFAAPFFLESLTSSQSTSDEEKVVTYKKQM